MSGPVLPPKVTVAGTEYEALPAPTDKSDGWNIHRPCTGCAATVEGRPKGLCSALPCFPDNSPLGALTIYKKVAQ